MERQRSQSVLQIRATSPGIQTRASKLLQKVSAKLTRNTSNNSKSSLKAQGSGSGDSPYMRQHSLDGTGTKPYMSQPILGLNRVDDPDSDGSASPEHTEAPILAAVSSPRPKPPTRSVPPAPVEPPISPAKPVPWEASTTGLPLRRARSQTLLHNWSRPTSAFGNYAVPTDDPGNDTAASNNPNERVLRDSSAPSVTKSAAIASTSINPLLAAPRDMLTTPPSARISALPPGAGAAYSPASYSPRDSGAFEIESPRNSIAPAASLTGSVSPTASHTSTSPSYVSPPTSYISTTSSSASYATAREPSGFSVLPILSANFPSESANGVTGLPVDSSRIIDASTGGLPSSISGLPSSLIPGNSSNIINANTGRLPSSSTSGLPSSLIPGMVSPHSPNQRGFSVSSITSGGVSGLPAPSGYSSSAANSGPYAQHQPQYANAHNLTVGAAGGAPLNLPSPTFSVISVSSVGSFQTARSRNSVSTVGSRRRANGSESGSSVSTARSRSRSSGSEYGGEEDADVTSRLSLNLPRTGSPTEMGDASLASAASAGANTPTPRNASTPTPTPQNQDNTFAGSSSTNPPTSSPNMNTSPTGSDIPIARSPGSTTPVAAAIPIESPIPTSATRAATLPSPIVALNSNDASLNAATSMSTANRALTSATNVNASTPNPGATPHAHRPPIAIPLSMHRYNSMTFSPHSTLNSPLHHPSAVGFFNGDGNPASNSPASFGTWSSAQYTSLGFGDAALGRLSPSIITRQPPLAIPVLRLPSTSLHSPITDTHHLPLPRSPIEDGGEGVTRRSSVIFGPPGAHGREASRAVVRSMPALGMDQEVGEGDGDGLAAGESESDEDEEEEDGEGETDEVRAEGRRGSAGSGTGRRESTGSGSEREGKGKGKEVVPPVPKRGMSMNMRMRLPAVDTSRLDLGAFFGGLGSNANANTSGAAGTPKGKERERDVQQTPIVVQAKTPKIPMPTPHAAGGKTPKQQASEWNPDYFSVKTPTTDDSVHTGTIPVPVPPIPTTTSTVRPPHVRTSTMPPSSSQDDATAAVRPGMYKQASRSMVNILTISAATLDVDERGAAPEYDGVVAPARNPTIKRRRSMPSITAAPPPYTLPIFPLPAAKDNGHPLAQARITPRDDEGREALPSYSNSILLRGVMPRKMEFSSPGVQARDRKWRRVVCELEGTVFRVYRCVGESWWERRLGASDVGNSAASVNAGAAAAVRAVRARAAEQAPRVEKGAEGEGPGTTEVLMPPRASMSSVRTTASSSSTSSHRLPPPGAAGLGSSNMGASRSRLNLGLSLLKPRSHGRSKSDLSGTPPTTPVTGRASLSIPRPSFGGSASSGSGSGGSITGHALTPSRSNVSVASSSATSDAQGSVASTPSSSPLSPRPGFLSARTPATASSSRSMDSDSQYGAAGTDVPEPNSADLIRAYTLQHAESGLGNDYVKRKHVIRVRLEGEQFLLQARDVGDVVDWIEGLHSATNIALDLDERVMPKGPLFPRRRRRRPRAAAAPGAPNTTATETTTPATSSRT